MGLNCFSLEDKVAIVTGGGRGLGKSMALAFAEAGADVVVTARTTSEIEQVAAQIEKLGRKALAVPTDITKEDQVQAMVDKTVARFGKVDILVNNAGISVVKPLVEQSLDEWNSVINTNLTAVFLCCRAVGPHMIKQKKGKVINISSIAGVRGGTGVFIGYSATKAGVNNFTKALAVEWARYNINVNAIAPGRFSTELSHEVHDDPETQNKILKKIALRRVAEPWEIGPLAIYLASPASDFMTGEVIIIDGGQSTKG